MNNITKVSDITYQDVADFIRLNIDNNDDNEINTLKTLLMVSKNYITKYTGQTDLDAYPDFVIVVLNLCQDMYDNRTLYVDTDKPNMLVDSILGMHSINLLPKENNI